jgi:hypothetical protein
MEYPLSKTIAPGSLGVAHGVSRKYSYHAYGISIRSDLRFPLKEVPALLEPAVEISFGDSSYFQGILRGKIVPTDPENWRERLTLPDGSEYVRWPDLFEFLVSGDGRRITYNPLSRSSILAFETYLLSMVLSCALLKLGYEVLHATAVIVDGEALALLGPSGRGKSSLAASFLNAGHHVLTDDLLVLMESDGRILIPPGIPRIKLFPEAAARLLPFPFDGAPMNPLTNKLVIPLQERYVWQAPAALRAVYRLPERSVVRPAGAIRVAPVPARAAFIKLLASTFNTSVVEPTRLKRHFELTSRVLETVAFRKLSFQRSFEFVPAVCEAIIADFRRLRSTSRITRSRSRRI